MKAFRTLMAGAAAAVALVVLGGCSPVDPAPSSTTSSSTTSTTTYTHCLTVRTSIETAIDAYAAGEGGMYPETLEPVAAMYLKPGTSIAEWTYTGLGTTYTLTGPC